MDLSQGGKCISCRAFRYEQPLPTHRLHYLASTETSRSPVIVSRQRLIERKTPKMELAAIKSITVALKMLDVPLESMQRYLNTAQARKEQRLVKLHQRREQGLELAQTAAHLLKTEFAASRVVLFGSLLSDRFHETSDLDLAVWSLPETSYFKAVSRLLALSAFAIDLVEVQYAPPELLAAIAQGLEL